MQLRHKLLKSYKHIKNYFEVENIVTNPLLILERIRDRLELALPV